MPTQAHARSTNATIARRQAEQQINGQCGILVVRTHFLLNLQLIACVGAWLVVGQRVG
jgi:hypothetical protein